MTFRKHLQFLYELFLPREARFPDEKFWTKSGDPIQMKRGGGPPPGTVGTTAKDWGVKDEPDQADGDQSTRTRDDLYDHFSKSFPEFQKAVIDAARHLYGSDFDNAIDQAFGRPGFTQQAIKDMWDGQYTDHEALGEIGFLFDTAQGGGYGTVTNYRHVTDPDYFSRPKEDWDDDTDATVPRTSRPIGSKGWKLVY